MAPRPSPSAGPRPAGGWRLAELAGSAWRDPAGALLPAVACAAVLAGLALAARRVLDGASLWTDEGFVLLLAQQGWPLLWEYAREDPHPPLYFAFMKLWTGLLGESEVSMRLPSLLAGCAALGALFAMGRSQMPLAAIWLSLALLGTHWHFLRHASEARMYAFVMLGGTWCALAFASLWNGSRPSGGRLAWFSLGALALAFLHYSAMAFACSALLLLLYRHRKQPMAWLPLGGAMALCVLYVLYHRLHMEEDWPVSSSPTGFSVLAELGPWRFMQLLPAHGHFWVKAAWHLSAFAVAAAILHASARKAGSWRAWLQARQAEEGWQVLQSLALLLLVFWLAMTVVGLYQNVWLARSTHVALPVLCICAAAVAARLLGSRPWLLAALAGLWACACLALAFRSEAAWGVDRQGIREMLRQWQDLDGEARIHCLYCWPRGGRHASSWQVAAARLDAGVHRPAYLRYEDTRHVVGPSFAVLRWRDKEAIEGARVLARNEASLASNLRGGKVTTAVHVPERGALLPAAGGGVHP